MKQTILNLFSNTALLDKDCLKDGVKHIQHSILVDRKDIKWIDAAYIGTNGELYFMITCKDEEIKSVQYEHMNIIDIYNWYHSLTSKLNMQTMAANKNFAQMSSKKLRELMPNAEPEDARVIEALLKARDAHKRLDELMLEKYPGMVYDAEQTDEFLNDYEGNLADENILVRDFVKYIKAEKFIIIKRVGDNDLFVEREFDDGQDAKDFVDLLRKSEPTKYVTYAVSQVLNY